MQGMRVVSVNVGSAETLRRGERDIVSGIHKRPLPSSVRIGSGGVEGDVICNTEHHGGADQAVYAYGTGDYDWWTKELGRRLEPGTFGENLTIEGLPDDLHVGDRLLIGNVILEATSPRIPCATLAVEMDDPGFGVTFRRAERPGFYFRVLNDGEIAAGDGVTLVEDPSSQVTMLDLFRLRYEPAPDRAALERALSESIAQRMRARFAARLAALGDET